MKSASFGSVIKYFREAKQELEKVTWPNQKEVTRYSILCIVISVLAGAYFGVLDQILSYFVEVLVNLAN